MPLEDDTQASTKGQPRERTSAIKAAVWEDHDPCWNEGDFSVVDRFAGRFEACGNNLWTLEGRFTGPIAGIAPGGKQLEITGSSLLWLRDMKLIAARACADIHQKLGSLPRHDDRCCHEAGRASVPGGDREPSGIRMARHLRGGRFVGARTAAPGRRLLRRGQPTDADRS